MQKYQCIDSDLLNKKYRGGAGYRFFVKKKISGEKLGFTLEIQSATGFRYELVKGNLTVSSVVPDTFTALDIH